MTSVENNMFKVEVVAVSGLNKLTKSMRLRFVDKKQAKGFIFLPGQFIMVGVLGFGEVPLTITTAPAELPEFEIAVRSVGVATQAMHRLKVGDTLYVRGPLGNSILTDRIYGKPLLLIAGGLGLAPLRSIIHQIKEDSQIVGKVSIVYGAKSPEDLLYKGELDAWKSFADIHLVVDKADKQWTGGVGRIPTVLEGLKLEKDAVVVVCGPPVMYKSVAKELLSQGLRADSMEFMLERRMKCGIGKCQHCTCGTKYVCTDGPTFTWDEIVNNPEALS